MGYYDSTVASFDHQIAQQYAAIDNYTRRIKTLEDDINELEEAKRRFSILMSDLGSTSQNVVNTIIGLPFRMVNPRSLPRVEYFRDYLDVVSGKQYKGASNSVENMIKKSVAKIRDMINEIEEIKQEIDRCHYRIASLRRQKGQYIAAALAAQAAQASQESST